jgi:PAS domain S-box-containing protein
MLVERMNEGAATLTSAGTILFCNIRLAEMMGLAPWRVIGSSFKSTLAEKEWERFKKLAQGALTNDVRSAFQLLRPDGTRLAVQLSLSLLPRQEYGPCICIIATDVSEQKQVEMRLQQQATLLDLASDAIVVRDMHNKILFWNRGAETIYGWSGQDVLGRDLTELLKTEFIEPAEIVRAELLRQGHWEGDAIQYKRNGERLIVASRSALQRDSKGVPFRILTINNDVTAHRRAEEAVRDGEERFRAMANNISQFAWIADEKGWIFWYNQRWFDYSGTTLEEMLGWGWQKIHHPDHVQRVVEKITRCFESGDVWEDTFPLRSREGNYRWFLSRAVPIRDLRGKVLRWFGTNTDITDRQQAEVQLQLLSERLSLATAVAKIGVWEWNVASNKASWDNTMLEIYGFPPLAAVTYEMWSAAVLPEDRPQAEATLREIIDQKGQGILEFRIVRTDGSIRNISGVCRTVFDESTNVGRVIGVNVDVTERKDAEKALEQSRKDQLRFKDELLSHVSHELRTPLTAIKQFSTVLMDGSAGELTEQQRQCQQIVLKNILQLQSMIDDLLEVSRLENGKIAVKAESTSVSEGVTDAINTFRGSAHAKGVVLSCDLLADLPAVYADPIRLRQILLILVDNALKFTPSGGAIKIRARSSERDAEFVLLEVSDTGCGISPEDSQRIFDRLYQAKETPRPTRAGLGLGLFICQGLVARQGGKIWVESQLNQGSTFSFTLPVFSVKTLIAPLLVNDTWPAQSVALVVVEIWPRELTPATKTGESWPHEAHSCIQSCLIPHLDVLLQHTRDDEGRQRFVIAAFADEKGISVLTRRIRRQLGLLPLIPEPEFSIFRTVPEPIDPEPHTSAKDTVNDIATYLQAAIRSQVLSEVVNCD